MLVDNYICAFFKYICYTILYLLIIKLMKEILNEDSDKFF